MTSNLLTICFFIEQAGKLGSIQLASLSALNGLGGFTGGSAGAINPAGKVKVISCKKTFFGPIDRLHHVVKNKKYHKNLTLKE